MLGSSVGLLRELTALAPFLGIERGADGEPTSDARRRMRDGDRTETGDYWREHLVWFTLYAAARRGVEHGTMIVFNWHASRTLCRYRRFRPRYVTIGAKTTRKRGG